jgi:hypothetical protein
VCDNGNKRLCLFDAGTGVVLNCHRMGDQPPSDAEIVEDGDGVRGWYVPYTYYNRVAHVFASGADPVVLGGVPLYGMSLWGNEVVEEPRVVHWVEGLGLVVREARRLKVFCTPDEALAWAMSRPRVAWMTAVARAGAAAVAAAEAATGMAPGGGKVSRRT